MNVLEIAFVASTIGVFLILVSPLGRLLGPEVADDGHGADRWPRLRRLTRTDRREHRGRAGHQDHCGPYEHSSPSSGTSPRSR